MPIRQFLFRHICVFRPNKKVFHILEWCRARNQWIAVTESVHANDIRLRKSLQHNQEPVKIPIRGRTINMHCNGTYLELADYEGRTLSKYIAVCTKDKGETIPTAYMKSSIPYPALPTLHHTEQKLWDLFEAKLEPILPPRIAYIIAEASVVKGELCPITLDDLSADTANVTTCFHVFQGEAIRKWLEKTPTCPVCTQRCRACPTQ